MKGKLWVWDLDDTLLFNVHDYAWAITEIPRVIVEALGSMAPHVRVIIDMAAGIDKQRLHEINPATGELYLYSMERFPGSGVETYREICDKGGIDPDPAVEERLYQTGMDAFDESRYRRNIMPGAKGVLELLAAKGDIQVLLTKGDPRVQERKINALREAGLDCFDKIMIVDTKDPAMFRPITEEFPDLTPISVGNSYESDILPALEAEYLGIYIPLETWETVGKMDEIKAGVDESRCRILSNLPEIIAIYEELL